MSSGTGPGEGRPDGVAIAFPGQGGHWRSAIDALVARPEHPLVRALADRLGTSAWKALDAQDTRHAQPVVYVAGLIGPAAELTTPVLAIGHSLGEITAAAWSGAFDPVDGLDLVLARADLGHDEHGRRPGAMAAVSRWDRPAVDGLRRQVLGREPGTLDIGVVNSEHQYVLSGDAALVGRLVDAANSAGAVARLLPIGGAYHSVLMAPAVAGFRRVLHSCVRSDPQVPLLSSTTQAFISSADELINALAEGLVLPVDWPATVRAAVAAGVISALEAGPGDTLTRLSRFLPALRVERP